MRKAAVEDRLYRLSAVALPAVALAVSFAAFDWLMSLTPIWFSTMYPIYYLRRRIRGRAGAHHAARLRGPRAQDDARLHLALLRAGSLALGVHDLLGLCGVLPIHVDLDGQQARRGRLLPRARTRRMARDDRHRGLWPVRRPLLLPAQLPAEARRTLAGRHRQLDSGGSLLRRSLAGGPRGTPRHSFPCTGSISPPFSVWAGSPRAPDFSAFAADDWFPSTIPASPRPSPTTAHDHPYRRTPAFAKKRTSCPG